MMSQDNLHGSCSIEPIQAVEDLVTFGMVDLVLETGHIQSAGDLAIGTGTGTARAAVHPQGGEPLILEGRYSVAFRRQPDGTRRNIVDRCTIDSERPAGD